MSKAILQQLRTKASAVVPLSKTAMTQQVEQIQREATHCPTRKLSGFRN
jgi:hypothetical protein